MVKIKSTSGTADMDISDFRQNNSYSQLHRLYLSGKFGEDWWKIATCRALNSFVYWLTDYDTHRQTNFITCPTLLMHWADNMCINVCHDDNDNNNDDDDDDADDDMSTYSYYNVQR